MSQGYLAEQRGSTNWGDRKSNQINISNQMLVFGERGKTEHPRKNLAEKSRQPTNKPTNSDPDPFGLL